MNPPQRSFCLTSMRHPKGKEEKERKEKEELGLWPVGPGTWEDEAGRLQVQD